MHPVIYDVAVSVDGFIAGRDNDVSAFPTEHPVVVDYLVRLENYATCLMGRRTYEFGFRFGLLPGQNPYPNMRAFVVSAALDLPENAEVTRLPTLPDVRREIAASQGPVYLCGGGDLAAAMLEAGMIDRLILKRAPCFLGSGVRLFGSRDVPTAAEMTASHLYDGGVLLQEFRLT